MKLMHANCGYIYYNNKFLKKKKKLRKKEEVGFQAVHSRRNGIFSGSTQILSSYFQEDRIVMVGFGSPIPDFENKTLVTILEYYDTHSRFLPRFSMRC